MAEPQDITRSPNLQVTLLSWAEGGGVVEPSAGRKDTGEIPNDLYTSNEHNWLGREPMRWLRALFSRYLSSGEALVGSWIVPNGTGVWSDDAVGPLEGFLSDGPAGTASLVSDVWLDPNDSGGVRVQVNVPKAGPATFLANKDTYIFAPIDLIVPPTVSEPELTKLDVPVGNPAPAAPAGTVLVWRVETDGAGIVDQEILLPNFPVMKQVAFEVFAAALGLIQGDLDVGGNVGIAGTLDVDGDSKLGLGAGNVQEVHGNVTVGTDNTNVQQVHGDVTVGTDVNSVGVLEGDVRVGTDSTSTTSLEGNATIGSGSSNTPSIKGNATIGSTSLSTHTVKGVMTLEDGMVLASGAVLTCNGGISVLGAGGGNITSDITALFTWNGLSTFNGRTNIATATSTTVGDISRAGGDLRWRDSTTTNFVHFSPNGSFKGHGQADTATGATVTLDTSTAVAPPAASDVDVHASAWIQRVLVGDVRVSLEEVGGAGQIGVSQDIAVPAGPGTDYMPITFSRTRVAADTTPRVYRLTVDGLGSNVTCKALRIVATPTTD